MKIIKRKREVIFDEADLEIVLKAIADTTKQSSSYTWFRGSFGNCGWADEPEKWFAHFNASEEDYYTFINKMIEKKVTIYGQDKSTKPWKTVPMN